MYAIIMHVVGLVTTDRSRNTGIYFIVMHVCTGSTTTSLMIKKLRWFVVMIAFMKESEKESSSPLFKERD